MTSKNIIQSLFFVIFILCTNQIKLSISTVEKTIKKIGDYKYGYIFTNLINLDYEKNYFELKNAINDLADNLKITFNIEKNNFEEKTFFYRNLINQLKENQNLNYQKISLYKQIKYDKEKSIEKISNNINFIETKINEISESKANYENFNNNTINILNYDLSEYKIFLKSIKVCLSNLNNVKKQGNLNKDFDSLIENKKYISRIRKKNNNFKNKELNNLLIMYEPSFILTLNTDFTNEKIINEVLKILDNLNDFVSNIIKKNEEEILELNNIYQIKETQFKTELLKYKEDLNQNKDQLIIINGKIKHYYFFYIFRKT